MQLTDEASPAALMQASPPVFTSPTTPETLQGAPIASPVKKLQSPSKSGVQVISQPAPKTTIRATFKVAISPPDSLPTVPEFEDGESGTPRGGAGGSLGSGPLKSLQNMHSIAFMGPGGPVDPVKGPMIDFWMLSEDECAPVEVEVLTLLYSLASSLCFTMSCLSLRMQDVVILLTQSTRTVGVFETPAGLMGTYLSVCGYYFLPIATG